MTSQWNPIITCINQGLCTLKRLAQQVIFKRKARRIYRQPINRMGYRQRGRCESVFGSLTNQFGDRFNAKNVTAMQTRISARIISYQIKLLIRTGNVVLVLIVRHARVLQRFK